MKLIGLLGGLSWDSTSLYYRMLNELTQKQLGGHHAARVLLHSVNHAAINMEQATKLSGGTTGCWRAKSAAISNPTLDRRTGSLPPETISKLATTAGPHHAPTRSD